jgi:hypothetical protein
MTVCSSSFIFQTVWRRQQDVCVLHDQKCHDFACGSTTKQQHPRILVISRMLDVNLAILRYNCHDTDRPIITGKLSEVALFHGRTFILPTIPLKLVSHSVQLSAIQLVEWNMVLTNPSSWDSPITISPICSGEECCASFVRNYENYDEFYGPISRLR